MTRTHGLAGTYSSGCRCDLCREAWRVYANRRRSEGKDVRRRSRARRLQQIQPWRGKGMAL